MNISVYFTISVFVTPCIQSRFRFKIKTVCPGPQLITDSRESHFPNPSNKNYLFPVYFSID